MSVKEFHPSEVEAFENATWSRCAGSYLDGFGALVAEALDPLLDAAGVREGARVLDVGTGPGLAAARAKARSADVVGIDFSEAMIAAARERHPDLDARVASAERLPFEDRSFDAVTGNFVLHHSGEPDRVLAEAARVLRPGGKAAFTVWGDMSTLEAFGVFFAAVEEHAGAAELPHGPLFGVSDDDTFHELLRAAGFSTSTARPLPIAWRTPSLDSYLTAFRDWANLDALPAPTVARIEETVRVRAEVYRLDDEYVLPNPAILIAGEK